MTFEKWWDNKNDKADTHWKVLAKSAWDYQQARIDELESRLEMTKIELDRSIDIALANLIEVVQLKRKEVQEIGQ